MIKKVLAFAWICCFLAFDFGMVGEMFLSNWKVGTLLALFLAPWLAAVLFASTQRGKEFIPPYSKQTLRVAKYAVLMGLISELTGFYVGFAFAALQTTMLLFLLSAIALFAAFILWSAVRVSQITIHDLKKWLGFCVFEGATDGSSVQR